VGRIRGFGYYDPISMVNPVSTTTAASTIFMCRPDKRRAPRIVSAGERKGHALKSERTGRHGIGSGNHKLPRMIKCGTWTMDQWVEQWEARRGKEA